MMNYVSGDAIEVGTVEQLVLDDAIVEDVWDLTRHACPPLRDPIGPVLGADRPWEDGIRGCHVFYDERDGLHRMLYQSVNIEAYQYFHGDPPRFDMAKHGPSKFVCYAESEDGVHWRKPTFEGIPWRNHPQTNIVMSGRTRAQAAEVFRNPDQSDEQRRYIMMYRDTFNYTRPDEQDGRCLAYSPDGIHWSEDRDNPITRSGSDGAAPVCWDAASRQWFCFCRPKVMAFDRNATDRPSLGNTRRRMAVITSPDLKSWSFPRTTIVPDELDINTFCVEGASTVFKWGSHFIATVPISDHTGSGFVETQLAFSSDGFHWQRLPDRPNYLDRGPEGSWDHHAAIPLCPPVERGDNWLLYYMGALRPPMRHWLSFSTSAIGVAVVPKGRLIGRFAGDRDGFLLTRELIIGGRYLDLHCERVLDRDGRPPCEIRVGVARRAHAANDHRDMGYYEGFAIDECDLMRSTSSALRVRWKGNEDLSGLIGKPAYLRFHMRNAGLYSFRFTDR